MNYNVVGGVTDDTQMTLFTAEGLISALLPILISQRGDKSAATDQTPDSTNPLFEAENYVPAVHQSYLRFVSDPIGPIICLRKTERELYALLYGYSLIALEHLCSLEKSL